MAETNEEQAKISKINDDCQESIDTAQKSVVDNESLEECVALNKDESREKCAGQDAATDTKVSSTYLLIEPTVSCEFSGMVIIHSEALKKSGLQIKTQCSMADTNKCQGPVVLLCIDCWDEFCDHCGKKHIMYSPKMKDHVVKSVGEVNETDIEHYTRKICKSHNKNISFYCWQCEKALCNSCVNKHKNQHEIEDMEAADEKFVARISEEISKFKLFSEECDEIQSKMFELKIQLKEKYNTAETELIDNIDNFKQQLQESYEKLLKEIENEKKSAIKLISDRFKDDTEQLDTNCLKMKEICEQLNGKLESCGVQLEPKISAIERAAFLQSLKKQPLSLDVGETNVTISSITERVKTKTSTKEWSIYFENWLQPAIDILLYAANKKIPIKREDDKQNHEEMAICGETSIPGEKVHHGDSSNPQGRINLEKNLNKEEQVFRDENETNRNEEDFYSFTLNDNKVLSTSIKPNQSDNVENITEKSELTELSKELLETEHVQSSLNDNSSFTLQLQITPSMWKFLDHFYQSKLIDTYSSDSLTITGISYHSDHITLNIIGNIHISTEIKQALESLPKKLGIKTQRVSLSEFKTTKEVAVIKNLIMFDHQVMLVVNNSDDIQSSNGYITGRITELKSASDRLSVMNANYATYRQKKAIYDEDIVNVYSTVTRLPLVISEPGRVFWQVFSGDDKQANVTVVIKNGDLLTEKVQAIVNASNSEMAHSAGVAKIIRQQAGEKIDKEGKLWLNQNGKIRLTHNAVTSAGSLPFSYIIHAVGPKKNFYKDENECIELLIQTFINCFSRADELNLISLALPAISTGKNIK